MEALTGSLNREDLVRVLQFCDDCLVCAGEETLHGTILELAGFLGYEFVLYAYMRRSYDKAGYVNLVNLSNPVAWMEEYELRGFLVDDPVRNELEVRLETPGADPCICWDAYLRPLSAREREIIERRRAWGLKFGFSVFDNSAARNSLFLVSFASASRQVDRRSLDIGRIVVSHLNRCRKRLDLLQLVSGLTRREKSVADWLVEGKTNWEIAAILKVTESTVKYHLANVFRKLHVANRQTAISILMAIRFLS